MTTAVALRDTPIETYPIDGRDILVKREDLCWPFPPLSKARGVYAAMEARPEAKTVAVVDTGRSLNGQLVATIGLTLGRKVICGYPVYKKDAPGTLPGPALAIKSLGVEMIGLAANRQFMMKHAMEQELIRRYGFNESWFLYPTGLRLIETIFAVEAEVKTVVDEINPGTIVVPTGTGTHLAGILRGFNGAVVAVQGYAREEQRFRRDVTRMCYSGRDLPTMPAFCNPAFTERRLRVVTSMCDYYENRAERLPPFPAHAHYEVRAWAWLHTPGVLDSLEHPVVLWNIGA